MRGTVAIRTTTADVKQAVIEAIKQRDPTAEFDPEGNPVTLWVDTELDTPTIETIKGVQDCIKRR